MKNKTVALVGCGRIGGKHIEAIRANEGIELKIACDANKKIASKTAESLGIEYVTDRKK